METTEKKVPEEITIYTITENGFLVDGSNRVSVPEARIKAKSFLEASAIMSQFLETRCYDSNVMELITPWSRIAFEPLKTKSVDEIRECIRAQKELCDSDPKLKNWHFAPSDGLCYDCRKNIYQNYGDMSGHDGRSYITGCPHCNYSFCE